MSFFTKSFDPDFYRNFYADLVRLSDDELAQHYEMHGFGEGRFGSKASFLSDLAAKGAAIPSDFDPDQYFLLNPDVEASFDSLWDAYRHYSSHGAREKRAYKGLDIDFFSDLYHEGRYVPPAQAVAEIRSAPLSEPKFQSMAALLRQHGIRDPFWLKLFSEREFSLINFDWIGRILNRAEAVRVFLEEGIDRVVPLSFHARFDPDFYRERHSSLSCWSDAKLYRHWLTSGADELSASSSQAWLADKRLDLSAFPQGFAWADYILRFMPTLDARERGARWDALEHLLTENANNTATVPVCGSGAGQFLMALGKRCWLAGDVKAAIVVFERAQGMEKGPSLLGLLGGAYAETQQWRAAAMVYDLYHKAGHHTVWSIVNLAKSQAKLADFSAAVASLLAWKQEYGGHRAWRDTLKMLVQEFFDHESKLAHASYASGHRSEGDAILGQAIHTVANRWKNGLSLPAPISALPSKRVVILGVTSLKQCKHYRIDQKQEYLRQLGYDCVIFDYYHVDNFLAALPGSQAAIFYRVPAMPEVVRAIISANALGVPTFYDIDDLIFDPERYPDSFESFQNAISPSVYQGLVFGTLLHREAMALCRFGLASTPALVESVSSIVSSGRAFLVRNALDSRTLKPLGSPLIWQDENQAQIRIVYGSGTLAHNQDFNDIAVGALLPLMKADSRIHLVIIGHLDLDKRFDVVRPQVHQLGLIPDVETYWSVLAQCHINLATLADTPMNNAKSEIKWLEAAVHRVPSIVSATRTYREVIDNGVTGIVASTMDEWRAAFAVLIENPAARKAMGEAARRQALRDYDPKAAARNLLHILTTNEDQAVSSKEKKRALIVNAFYPPQSIGGATRVVADTVRCWLESGARDDWDFAVATTDFDNPRAYEASLESWDGIPVFRIAPPFVDDLDWRPTDEKMGDWFAGILAALKPDIVHFHCVQRLTGSVVQACIDAEIPYVISAHDGWWLSDYQFLFDEKSMPRLPGDELARGIKPGLTYAQSLQRKRLLQPLLDHADIVVTPSQTFAQLYRDAGLKRVQVIANGLPNLVLPPRRPSPQGRVRIGHIGDMSPHKGFDLLEAALRQNNFENIELIGISHARETEDETRTVWGASPVLLKGKVPQDRVGDLYAELDVLAAPSACVESFGLVTREANAAGLWVIASDRGAIGEDVRPGIDGFVIDVSNPSALSETLAIINADPARFLAPAPTRKIVHAAAQATETLALFDSILRKQKGRPAERRSKRAFGFF